LSVERRIRVLVVDDSALARRAICDALATDPGLEVVGTAADAYIARDRILELQPDVVTLDLQMPRMDGLTFLRILQEHHPVPVVVLSAMTPAGSALALEALQAGAIEVLAKPDGGTPLTEIALPLTMGVRAAARARGLGTRLRPQRDAAEATPAPLAVAEAARRVIVIGASTGGVEALRYLLPQLPAGLPPIVIVQHIPAAFSRIMAQHLDELCPFNVREASEGEVLQPGSCLVAPGNFHALLQQGTRGYTLRLAQTPPVHHCRPSVDVLFRSAAEVAGAHAVGVLLTGMGVDGARGLLRMRQAGARTFAEAEESCVVYGMPAAAAQLGAAEQVLPLAALPKALFRVLAEPPTLRLRDVR
jgi:two-component system chemotaxis response regulator CheB